MKNLTKIAAALTLSFAATTASALVIDNVAFDATTGVQFDTVNSLYATDVTAIGDEISGIGRIVLIDNSLVGPGELTYVFDSYTVTSFDGLNFVATGGSVRLYSDASNNYDSTIATASDGNLWLNLIGNGELAGTVAVGASQGSASGLLDVIGGLAALNFDTDAEASGADLSFNASYSSTSATVDGFTREGSSDLHGNPVDAPNPLALLGLGLGLIAASRAVKSK